MRFDQTRPFMASTPLSVSQENSIRMAAMCCLTLGGHRNGLNVFEGLVPGALGPSQELLDRPIISGPGVRVADWDR
jgi:hypothetical protein